MACRFCAIVCACIALTTATPTAAASKRRAPNRAPNTLHLKATAYCDSGTTQSGVRTRTGIVAADPQVLPVGSVVRILDGASTGIYTVMDTGAAVKGAKIDIFEPDCARAKQFGERAVRLRVLRRGWDPKASADDDGRY